MRSLSLLAFAALLTTTATAETVLKLGQFRSIELRNGGSVVVRHGPVQRVTILEGDADRARIAVEGQNLVIDNRNCRSGERAHVEVVTPEIAAAAVSNGGTLRTVGAFPAQASIKAAVESGGTLDIRSIAAGDVDAAVGSGGRIFLTARQSLDAIVQSGGGITYWGRPDDVRRVVRDGGVVTAGALEDADKPLSDLTSGIAPIPPVPPVPPVPPIRHKVH